MKQYYWDMVVAATVPPAMAIKLIRKLRWVGLEEDARRLQESRRVAWRDGSGILADIPCATD